MDWFESRFVGNPEERVSRVAVQFIIGHLFAVKTIKYMHILRMTRAQKRGLTHYLCVLIDTRIKDEVGTINLF